MKKIALTKGQFALVDDKDYDWLSQWYWFASWTENTKSFYAGRRSELIDGKQQHIMMAREILGLKRGDERFADHINHDTLNNQRSNLRAVTASENQWNRKGAKGYCWVESRQKYQVAIQYNYKTVFLGSFVNKEDAHQAYLDAKEKYHVIVDTSDLQGAPQ